ncbi:MAG: CBS domain-containing protein [Deltaproteobacteria bacterium]|nr:CBS domain-containing protein [Deltaproteobacteria bacterium]
MGSDQVARGADEPQMRAFTKAVLDDLRALEQLIELGRFETGVRRIGAEQEMFLLDASCQPAPVATQILERLAHDKRLAPELARFNLEANLSPHVFGGSCLRAMERELGEVIALVDQAAAELGVSVVLTGILPTLRRAHLTLDHMTPNPRYLELNRAACSMRGNAFEVVIKGLDELHLMHDNVMLESANTSFQIHFQVSPEEFARLYNVAQVVSGPVLAAAVNSPLLLGHRLWNETRVALFQHSVDTRSAAHKQRAVPPRVSFGESWIRRSILEIYRDDIARFRMLVSTSSADTPPGEVIAQGGVPELSALRMYTGTVWRWNRACYGTSDGRPHLRIETRVLPAGPTVLDEIANAAFFFGLMASLSDEYGRIDEVMEFDDAKNNFFAAARHGLNAQFNWIGRERFTARDLIVNVLLPHARHGLATHGIDAGDIERYLGTIEERVERQQTGSQWALRSLAQMGEGPVDVQMRSLASAMVQNQRGGLPVHDWPLAELYRVGDWFPSFRTVGQFMDAEVFTVRPGDPIDLVASIMDWRQVRHIPVEDDQGRLAGLVSFRAVLRQVGAPPEETAKLTVRDIMQADPVTVSQDSPTLRALELMREHNIGCLPVVEGEDGRLVGVVTVDHLLSIAGKVLEDFLRREKAGRDERRTEPP